MSVAQKIKELYEKYKTIVSKEENKRRFLEAVEKVRDIIRKWKYNHLVNDVEEFYIPGTGNYEASITPVALKEEYARYISHIASWLGAKGEVLITTREITDNLRDPVKSLRSVAEFVEEVKELSEDAVFRYLNDGYVRAYIKLDNLVYLALTIRPEELEELVEDP